MKEKRRGKTPLKSKLLEKGWKQKTYKLHRNVSDTATLLPELSEKAIFFIFFQKIAKAQKDKKYLFLRIKTSILAQCAWKTRRHFLKSQSSRLPPSLQTKHASSSGISSFSEYGSWSAFRTFWRNFIDFLFKMLIFLILRKNVIIIKIFNF